jgi:hypothetical protein
MEKFTVYLLTLTEAGFKETIIEGCTESAPFKRVPDIEFPGGYCLEGHTLERAINTYKNRTYHYNSRYPDFEVGKRAIMDEVRRNVKSMRELADSNEWLLKYETP